MNPEKEPGAPQESGDPPESGVPPESGPPEESGAPLPTHPRARGDLVFRELADEWVVFDPVGRDLHVLNLTAALVWTHCSGEHEVEEIVRRVESAFDEAPPTADVDRDVRAALATLSRAGLLE